MKYLLVRSPEIPRAILILFRLGYDIGLTLEASYLITLKYLSWVRVP